MYSPQLMLMRMAQRKMSPTSPLSARAIFTLFHRRRSRSSEPQKMADQMMREART